MPGYRDVLLPILDRARTLVAQVGGLRQYTVTPTIETYPGPIADGVGAPTLAGTALVPAPDVERLSEIDAQWYGGGNYLVTSTGRMYQSVYKISRITPRYTGTVSGGYDITNLMLQVNPATGDRQRFVILLSGPDLVGNEPFTVVHIDQSSTLHVTLVVRRVQSYP